MLSPHQAKLYSVPRNICACVAWPSAWHGSVVTLSSVIATQNLSGRYIKRRDSELARSRPADLSTATAMVGPLYRSLSSRAHDENRIPERSSSKQLERRRQPAGLGERRDH